MTDKTITDKSRTSKGFKLSPGNFALNALKGAVIAIGAVLPGISGGALCVIMGIYSRVMSLLAHPFKEIKLQWKFFVPIIVGFALGTILSSKLVGAFMERYETPALFLFIGLIVGTLPSLIKEAQLKGRTIASWISLVVACALMLSWMVPMVMSGGAKIQPNLFWWCICGVLWGLGIVVPGMSPSNIMLFLGIASPMYTAIGNFDLTVIIPMGLSLLLTILALSKGVGFLLEKFYSIFMHAVIGVVLASTIVILPPVKLLIDTEYSFKTGAIDWLIYILCFGAGIGAAFLLNLIQKPENETTPTEENKESLAEN